MAKRFNGVVNVDITQSVPDWAADAQPIAPEGLNVGKDGAEAVSDDYPGQAPWPFTDGTIRRATVDVSGQPFVDLAAEARMALLRD